MTLPDRCLGRTSPGNDEKNENTTCLRGTEVYYVPRSQTEATRTVQEVSSRKGSGDQKIEGRVGTGIAKTKNSADDQKRSNGTPTTGALDSVAEISDLLVSELAKLGGSESMIAPQQLSLPFYGNYCGRGHGDPTGKTPPIDAVDAVCRAHNACYRLLGDFDDRCDRNLIEIMPSAIASTPSPVGKKAGLLALLYFSLVERNLALGETLFKRT